MRRIARIIRGVDKSAAPSPTVRPLELLQGSDHPAARKVWDVYSSVPEPYRELLPAEAYYHAAGVPPLDVLEVIAVIAVRRGATASATITAAMHPRVLPILCRCSSPS